MLERYVNVDGTMAELLATAPVTAEFTYEYAAAYQISGDDLTLHTKDGSTSVRFMQAP